MKHVVELKYTNPSHEHVSLRRRVETVNRVVEAQSADEALNRAANQQRALGFRIQSANIVEQTEVISEGVELEEGKVAKALAVGAMSLASMGAKAHTDTTKSVAQLAAERPALAQRLHDIGATGQVPASDKRAAELQRKQDQEMPASERRAKQLKKEEVDIDEAKKPLKPSYWKAEWRLGTQSEVDKNNKKIYDKLAKTDPDKAKKFHDNLMKIRKEEVEQMTEDQASDMQKIQSMDKGSMTGGKAELKTHLKYLQAMHTHQKKHGLDTAKTKNKIEGVSRTLVQMGEEVEQVDEANMRFDPEAAARPKSSDVKNFLNRDKNPRAAAASKKYIRRMTKLGGLGPNQTKKDTEAHMKAHFEEFELDEASKEGKDVMRNMRASMKSMDLRHGVDSDKRVSGYKMSPAVKAAQAKSDALSKTVKRPQAGTLAAAKMKKEEVETVEEGLMGGLKKAQAKWKTAHRAVYGKDPSVKSMAVGAIAKLAGAKNKTARAVGAAVGGKPVSKQQQDAAKARAGKASMAKMRNEEKHESGDDVNSNVKGKKAAEKMTKKAAEIRKSKIEGSVNKINMEPTIDLNKKAEK